MNLYTVKVTRVRTYEVEAKSAMLAERQAFGDDVEGVGIPQLLDETVVDVDVMPGINGTYEAKLSDDGGFEWVRAGEYDSDDLDRIAAKAPYGTCPDCGIRYGSAEWQPCGGMMS